MSTAALLYPPSERSETGGYTVFTLSVCLSVRTQSINRLCRLLADGSYDVIAARRAAVNPFCVI